ncbi:SCP2 sterol-binding domain-containing protein [Limoniibacter endophyticus]|uniref:Sterol-binding protein n=1 Tax=Limoniibacter endophyticus TaxID=1565040 RepID=A0A8J3DGF0_9HYPH|nr:SCP2 sterol-binding domain-containing protein [Limoniibacter endophyticus]GHC64414.1 sterol-binding protein [Limoniibacter endophyticus]
MSIETLASQIQSKLDGSGFSRNVKLDLGSDGVIVLDGEVVSTENSDADCLIEVSKDNLEKIVAGDLNPTTAAMTGKMKIKGDMSAAMALAGVL